MGKSPLRLTGTILLLVAEPHPAPFGFSSDQSPEPRGNIRLLAQATPNPFLEDSADVRFPPRAQEWPHRDCYRVGILLSARLVPLPGSLMSVRRRCLVIDVAASDCLHFVQHVQIR